MPKPLPPKELVYGLVRPSPHPSHPSFLCSYVVILSSLLNLPSHLMHSLDLPLSSNTLWSCELTNLLGSKIMTTVFQIGCLSEYVVLRLLFLHMQITLG